MDFRKETLLWVPASIHKTEVVRFFLYKRMYVCICMLLRHTWLDLEVWHHVIKDDIMNKQQTRREDGKLH